ncbi:MAG: hypothetical protein JSW08_01060 [archaeon]|nr:MAG: hypothetical protein JSW08_01060 [archaeon]
MINIYEIPKDKLQTVKKILEAQDQAGEDLDFEIEKEAGKGKMAKAKSWNINEFRKQGYALRDSKALNLEGDSSYLYIKGDESFFERNEKKLTEAGAKKIEGETYEKVKEKVEEQENSAASGFGSIFS